MGEITLRNVSKSFGITTVIPDIDLEIANGEFVVFVGPSGCGKSTLLRMIAGLEEITAGDLAIDGQRANDVPPSERGLAMVFQTYALYPHMSVADNMGFSLRLAGASKAERKAKVGEAARILHLEKLLDRKPKELSGGQRQRVAIGRAIVRKPKVFLFDEPLSNLDAALRVQMRIELARLHDELAATMIYVTHDQVEAMTMTDKIVVLQGGVVEQAGSPLELYHHPRNLFVAGFIGSPKMNFMPATVEAVGEAGATVRVTGGGSLTVPVRPGRLKAGDPVTLGCRPEHMRPGDAGEIQGEVMVVERLGGETFLYTQVGTGEMLVIQADGEIPTRAHERIAIRLDPATCHLFDAEGLAVERAHRHPLADMRRPTAPARKAG